MLLDRNSFKTPKVCNVLETDVGKSKGWSKLRLGIEEIELDAKG